MDAKGLFSLLKDTFKDWNEDKAPRLAAALAYYTVFSLAPLLVIAIAIAGFFLGREAVQGQLTQQIQGLVGQQGAEAIQAMIAGAEDKKAGTIATIIGIVTLLFGAAGLFGQLQDALNTIWEVQPKPNQGIMATLKQRFFSFTMVLGTGFLLLVSLVVSTGLAAVTGYFQNILPGADIIWSVVNFVVAFAVTAGLFALMFKIIPDAEIAWKDVWIGAAVTALLFSIGRFVLGWYLGRQADNSSYGAAGSLVIVLLWVYYSAQILLFGAEFTQLYAQRYGSRIKPAPNAMPVTEEARAQQGIPREETLKERAAGQPYDTAAPTPAAVHIVDPAEGPKPGAVTTAVGFALGWLLGRNQKARR